MEERPCRWRGFLTSPNYPNKFFNFMRSALYINGRVMILPLNCWNRELSRLTPQLHRWSRIVEFVYQGAIHKECTLLNRLLIVYLLCNNAYPTHTSLKFQTKNPLNPCHPR